MPLPERRGSRQREQQRKKGRQPHDQVDAGVDIRHRDMHVHSAEHVAVADHLKVIHDRAVARLARHHLLGPVGERKCPHGRNAELVLGRLLRERAAIMREMRARFLHAGAGRRRDLELRLQHFGHHAVAQLLLCACEEFLARAAHRMARLRVEHEIFFFHAQRIHARNNLWSGPRFPNGVSRHSAKRGASFGRPWRKGRRPRLLRDYFTVCYGIQPQVARTPLAQHVKNRPQYRS